MALEIYGWLAVLGNPGEAVSRFGALTTPSVWESSITPPRWTEKTFRLSDAYVAQRRPRAGKEVLAGAASRGEHVCLPQSCVEFHKTPVNLELKHRRGGEGGGRARAEAPENRRQKLVPHRADEEFRLYLLENTCKYRGNNAKKKKYKFIV